MAIKTLRFLSLMFGNFTKASPTIVPRRRRSIIPNAGFFGEEIHILSPSNKVTRPVLELASSLTRLHLAAWEAIVLRLIAVDGEQRHGDGMVELEEENEEIALDYEPVGLSPISRIPLQISQMIVGTKKKANKKTAQIDLRRREGFGACSTRQNRVCAVQRM
ncbi:hypothetical protein MLD38_036108 [Melastoma candidum]|uniref:Uncharacterized protein n=1 Tax=Melastoma candidum TaxID=119954 RepID=A0ACB9LKJ8_9MYRT|nr:hypothetical protein MLD38_036108 [Melastoma candidum]